MMYLCIFLLIVLVPYLMLDLARQIVVAVGRALLG